MFSENTNISRSNIRIHIMKSNRLTNEQIKIKQHCDSAIPTIVRPRTIFNNEMTTKQNTTLNTITMITNGLKDLFGID